MPRAQAVLYEVVGKDELAAAEHERASHEDDFLYAEWMERLGRKGRETVPSPGHCRAERRAHAGGRERAELSAVGTDAVAGVADDGGALVVRHPCGGDPFRPFGQRDIVSVRFDEELAVREGGQLHPVPEDAQVVWIAVEDHGDVRGRRGGDMVLDELGRAVRRAVVGDDYLERAVRLRERPIERGADPLALVVAQQAKGDKWAFHANSYPLGRHRNGAKNVHASA